MAVSAITETSSDYSSVRKVCTAWCTCRNKEPSAETRTEIVQALIERRNAEVVRSAAEILVSRIRIGIDEYFQKPEAKNNSKIVLLCQAQTISDFVLHQWLKDAPQNEHPMLKASAFVTVMIDEMDGFPYLKLCLSPLLKAMMETGQVEGLVLYKPTESEIMDVYLAQSSCSCNVR